MTDLSRRGVLVGGASGSVGAAIGGTAAAADPHPFSTRTVRRIAFGSCAKENKDQPIWDAILATKPDLMILLGDNVYLDTRDPLVMKAKYAMLAAKPGFQRLRAEVPVLAIWDDHDYGEDDAGVEFPMKEASRKLFCDFWGEAAASPRRTRDGIYAAHIFGPSGQRVQVLLPDLRWNRTPLSRHDLAGASYDAWVRNLEARGAAVPGPYARIPDASATMLGAKQWNWLEEQLALEADVRILASSLQVVADFPGWEAWINYTGDHQRLISTIRSRRANGLIAISGDTHYGEISRLDVNVPYPLWDITSSGLTEVWPVLPPNARRIGPAYRARNFGLIDIDWAARRVETTVRDEGGSVQLRQSIPLATLQVA